MTAFAKVMFKWKRVQLFWLTVYVHRLSVKCSMVLKWCFH